jgi:hypothetical protein
MEPVVPQQEPPAAAPTLAQQVGFKKAARASKALAALPKADMVCILEKLHAGGKAATVSAVLKEQITEAAQERRTA